jgi:hypothetical protein
MDATKRSISIFRMTLCFLSGAAVSSTILTAVKIYWLRQFSLEFRNDLFAAFWLELTVLLIACVIGSAAFAVAGFLLRKRLVDSQAVIPIFVFFGVAYPVVLELVALAPFGPLIPLVRLLPMRCTLGFSIDSCIRLRLMFFSIIFVPIAAIAIAVIIRHGSKDATHAQR